jgi:transposase
MTTLRYIGLDVHAETIVISVADAGAGPAVNLKTIGYDEARLYAELKKLCAVSALRVCYEAGPTGFGLQRYLAARGVDCVVVAPSLIPQAGGNRVKTDRRDSRKLAHFLRSGDLTAVWIPDEHTEALRDLERARDDARLAERRARQQLLKFLLRQGLRFTEGKSNWTLRHWAWIRRQKFALEAQNRVLADYVQTAQQATERIARLTHDIAELVEEWALAPLVKNLQAFRGVELVTAVGLAAEIADFTRFESASQFMAFVGLVPSENSSGGTRRQGAITKTGNGHVRRLLIEASWHYYSCPAGISATLRARRVGVPPEVTAIADKALERLRRKAHRMKTRGKTPNKIATALARELAGFLWAAACETARLSGALPPAGSRGGNATPTPSGARSKEPSPGGRRPAGKRQDPDADRTKRETGQKSGAARPRAEAAGATRFL